MPTPDHPWLRALARGPFLLKQSIKPKWAFSIRPVGMQDGLACWQVRPKSPQGNQGAEAGLRSPQERMGGVVPRSHKLYLRPRSTDWRTFESIFSRHAYALRVFQRGPEIVAQYHRILAAGGIPLIIDAGANAGYAAAWFALLFPQAKVLAIEPEPANAALALRNTAALPGVHVIQAAVASEDSKLVFESSQSDADAFRTRRMLEGGLSAVEPSAMIDAYSIPSLMKQAGSACVPWIAKIDIEGFESELFSQGVEWIDSFALMIVETHDWMLPGQASTRPMLAALAERDRDFVQYGETIWSFRNPAQPVPADPTLSA